MPTETQGLSRRGRASRDVAATGGQWGSGSAGRGGSEVRARLPGGCALPRESSAAFSRHALAPLGPSRRQLPSSTPRPPSKGQPLGRALGTVSEGSSSGSQPVEQGRIHTQN